MFKLAQAKDSAMQNKVNECRDKIQFIDCLIKSGEWSDSEVNSLKAIKLNRERLITVYSAGPNGGRS